MNKFMQAIVDTGESQIEIEGRIFKDPETDKFLPWTLKKLSVKEVRKIRSKYIKTKKGKTKTDEDGMSNAMLLASIVEPNFKDPEWLSKEGLVDPVDLMSKYLSNFGDYQYVLNQVLDLSGFNDEIEEEDFEEAKN